MVEKGIFAIVRGCKPDLFQKYNIRLGQLLKKYTVCTLKNKRINKDINQSGTYIKNLSK
jgi:hypothetical protein